MKTANKKQISGRRISQGSNALLRWATAALVTAGIMAVTAPAWSDDTEVFLSTYGAGGASGRPKVLVIFDTSGSMGTIAISEREPYDPLTVYPQQGSIQSGRIYWSTDGIPPSTGTSRYFTASRNRCSESFSPLDTVGSFTGRVGRWSPNRRDSRSVWRELSTNVNDPPHVDCAEDVDAANPDNGGGQSDGYPRDFDRNNPYTTNLAEAKTDWSRSGYAVTLFSANYMNWWHNDALLTERTRIEVAQDVLKEVITSTPGVDYGLAVFNQNGTSDGVQVRNGGRIISAIHENMTDAERAALLTTIDGMVDGGWTPLCETYSEAYRYITGDRVLYGNDDPASTPGLDPDAHNGINYFTPMGDCEYIYVILMTDGLPTYDTMANDAIETLTGKTCGTYQYDSGQGMLKNCLPTLAEYMNQTDLDGDPDNGAQKVITYTIGFQTDQTLLSDTAIKGGGKYFTASDSSQLTNALRATIQDVLKVSTTFTAPAVAVDSFQRTFHRNDVFMAMFEPQGTADWPGNIKKLKLNSAGELVDADGALAIDPASGRIKETARTFWTPAGIDDGDKVRLGGIGGLLAARNPATRVIKTNTGSGGALEDFDVSSFDPAAFGFSTQAEVYDLFGVSDGLDFLALINWSRGFDVEDEDGDWNILEPRSWILGDMLHSRPTAINYGALGAHTNANPDIRLVVGTNHGFVHMFGAADDHGQEDWAFFPKELAPILADVRANSPNQHPYGVDNTPVIYTDDQNSDGTLDAGAGDKVYLYLTMRRGGDQLYALDVSNPDAPSYMWMIDSTTTGFDELGQSWSIPRPTFIPGYEDASNNPKPVLIFGGGYDTVKDTEVTSSPYVVPTDSVGRGVFIIDAVTGVKVWSVTPGVATSTNKHEVGLEHGMVAQPAILDSNGDRRADRIYMPDTGGNVWRIDLGDIDKSNWVITHVANLNGGGEESDRRFFNRISVSRTRHFNEPFESLAFGSGNRAHPLSTEVDERFYMIQDTRVGLITPTTPILASCSSLPPEVPHHYPNCAVAIVDADLYDATANLIQDGSTDAEKQAALDGLLGKAGWRLDLEGADYSGGTGEKSLSPALTLDGVIWFTTFEPLPLEADLCVPRGGTGYLYAVDLQDASAKFDFTFNNTITKPDRRVTLFVPSIPDTPAVHFGEDNVIRLLFPSGGGPIPDQIGNPTDSGSERVTPKNGGGLNWYEHEPQ